jgi:hypothetical protein
VPACSDQTAEHRRAATRQFDQVLTQLDQAQAGPEAILGNKANPPKDSDLAGLMKARSEALRVAGARLTELLPHLAPAQQVQARRALAVTVVPAAIDFDQFRALQAWGALAVDLPRLAGRLDTLAQTAADARTLDVDTAPRRARIKEDLDAANAELTQATQARQAVAQEAADLQPQLQAQTTARDQASTQANDLRAQAMQKSGAAQTALYLQALAADLTAQKADAQIDRLGIAVAAGAERLKIADLQVTKAQDQIEAANRQLAQLDGQDKARQALRQAVLGTGASPAAASVKALAADFLRALDSLDSRFQQDVDAPFNAAATPAAAEQLRQALGQADPDSQRLVRLELLRALVAYLGVLDQQQAVLASYGRQLDSLTPLAQAAIPEDGKSVAMAAYRIKAEQKDIDIRARKARDEASILADELTRNVAKNAPESTAAVAQAATGLKTMIASHQTDQPPTP